MPVKSTEELTQPGYVTNPDPNINKILNKEYSSIAPPVTYDDYYGSELDQPLIRTQVLSDLDESDRELFDSDNELANIDPEILEELRAQDQSVLGNMMYRAPLRTAGKIVQEVLHGVGMIGGGLGLAGQAIGGQFGWNQKPKDTHLIFDNAFNNGIDDAFNSFYNSEALDMKVHIPKKVQEGSLVDNMLSSSFWATEGADAVGFFTSMMLPGIGISKLALGEKIASGLNKIKPISNLLSKADVAGKIDQGLSIAFNTAFESASEASGVYKDIKDGLIAKGEDPDIANQIASDKAAKVFGTNLGILLLPNTMMQQNLLGKFIPKQANMLGEVSKEMKKINLLESSNFWKNAVGKVTEGVAAEGFFEEGLQTATGDYYTKQGLNKQLNQGVFTNLKGIIDTYSTMLPNDIGMQKAVFLGGMMGGFGGGIGAIREYKSAQNTIYGNEGPKSKLGKKLSETSLGQVLVSPKQKGFKQLLDEGLLTWTSEGLQGAIEKDDKGNYKLKDDATDYLYNPDSVKLLGEDQAKRLTLNKITEDAQEAKDKESVDRYINLAQFDTLKPFLATEAGIDYLKNYFIPQESDIFVKTINKFKNNISQDVKDEYTPEKINKLKSDLIDKIDLFKKVYDEVSNKHNYETSIKADPKYNTELNNFLSQIKNNKMQGKLDIAFANNRIDELNKRNNDLISGNKFEKTSFNQLKEGDLVERDNKKGFFIGKNEDGKYEFIDYNDFNKTFTLSEESTKVRDKATTIQLVPQLTKLDANDGILKELSSNANDISYHEHNIKSANKMLNVMYDNKKAQSAFDEKIKRVEKFKKLVEINNIFKPESVWKEKSTGNKYKVQNVNDVPVLFKETLDKDGNPEYLEEYKDTNNLLENPDQFKNNFEPSEATKPIVKEEVTPIEDVQDNEVISDTEQSLKVNTGYNVGDEVNYNGKKGEISYIYPDGRLKVKMGNKEVTITPDKLGSGIAKPKITPTSKPNTDKEKEIKRNWNNALNEVFETGRFGDKSYKSWEEAEKDINNTFQKQLDDLNKPKVTTKPVTKATSKSGMKLPEFNVPDDVKNELTNVPKNLEQLGNILEKNIPIDEDNTLEEQVDTSKTEEEENNYFFNAKARPLENIYSGSANNPRIGVLDEYTGDPNPIKFEKVVSDLIDNTDNFKLKAFLAKDIFPQDEEYFKEVTKGTSYKFEDVIYVALTDKEGNLLGLNQDSTKLIPLEGSLYELGKENNRKFIYSAIRMDNPISEASGLELFYRPDYDTQRDQYIALDSNLAKLQGKEFEEKAKEVFDAKLDELTKEHTKVRENIKNALNRGEEVLLPLLGKSMGIPNSINEYGSTSDVLTKAENVDVEDIVNKYKVVVAQKNQYTLMINNTKINSKPGFTYLHSDKTGNIYRLDPKKLSSDDVTNVVDLLQYYTENLNRGLSYENAIKLNVNGTDLGYGVFGYISDMIHSKYIDSTGKGLSKALKIASKNSHGDWVYTKYQVVIKKDNNHILNPKLVEALYKALPNFYHQIKALKIDKNDPYLNIKSIDKENGVIDADLKTSYKKHVLTNITQTNVILKPEDKDINLPEHFGGGTMKVQLPLFASKYLIMDFSEYKPSNEVPDVKESNFVGPLNPETIQEDYTEEFKDSFIKAAEEAKSAEEEDIWNRKSNGKVDYELEDLVQAKEWFVSKFPQFGEEGFKIVDNLISKGIFGQVSDYAMKLDNLAEKGTVYHEAYHMASFYLLPQNQVKELYNEWRLRNKSKLSDKEVEEELAEDFRDFMLNNGKMKLPPIQENLFKKLWRWIKSFFTPDIKKTFEKISSGYYSNTPIHASVKSANRGRRRFESEDPKLSTIKYHKQIMNAVNVYFFDEIRKELGSFDTFYNKSNNQELIGRTYTKIKKTFENKLKESQDFVNSIESKYNAGTATQKELADSAKHLRKVDSYKFILDQFNDKKKFDELQKDHWGSLTEFGLSDKFVSLDDNLNEDKINENDKESTKDAGYELSDRSIKFSAKNNAQKTIKLLIGTLPELKLVEDKYEIVENELGLPSTMKFGRMFNTILQALTKSKGLEEIIDKLNVLKEDLPSLQYFFTEDGMQLNKVLDNNYLDIPKGKFNELMQFAQTFSKTEEEFGIDLLNEGGERVLNEANTQTKRKGIHTQWKNNAAIKSTKGDKYFNKDGNYNTDAFKALPYVQNINGNYIVDFTIQDNLTNFLSLLGIEFTNWNKINKIFKNSTIQKKATTIFNSIIKNVNSQPNIFNVNVETDLGGDLTTLIDIEYDTNIDVNELQHNSIGGEKVYNHVLNSYITNILDNINKFNTWDDMVLSYPNLNTELIDYVKNSMLLKKGGLLFSLSGKKKVNQATGELTQIKRVIVEGIREQVGGDATEYNKLSKADRFASVFDRMLLGQSNLLRTADKTLERFLSVDFDKTLVNPTEYYNIYKGYLSDEIDRYKTEQRNGFKNEWKFYSENVKDLQGIMLEMIKTFNISESYYNEFVKLLQDKTKSTEDILNTKNIKELLRGTLKNYTETKMNEYKDWLVSNKVIEYNRDKGAYIVNGINFGSKEITPITLANKLEDFLFKDTMMNIEQTKLLFGDPAMFKTIPDFFKRTGSFPGTKKIMTSDYITDTWIEQNLKRTDHAEGLVDTKLNAKLYSKDKSKLRNKPIIKMMVFNDPKVYDEVFGEIGEETDGYSLISLDEAREMYFRAGDWGFGEDSLEDLYQWEMQRYYGPKIGQDDFMSAKEYKDLFGTDWNGTVRVWDDKLNKFREVTERPHKQFNMIKPLHVGPYAEEGYHMGIVKTSFGILYPSSTIGFPNKEKMMNFMRKNKLGVVSFASANKGITTKLNQKGKIQELYNENGELTLDSLILEGNDANAVTQDTYYENWGIQLDTGFKNKENIITGTQMMKQILSFMYEDGKINSNFESLQGDINEYLKINAERLDVGKQILLDELDITVKDGEYYIQDYDKFKTKLKKIADSRNMDDNIYESIDFIEETLGMDILLNRNAFEAAIFGLNDSTVIKQKRAGGAFYQQPHTLYEKGKRNSIEVNGKKYIKSSEELKTYTNEDDEITAMEVYLPNVFKGIPIEQLEDILTNGIAFRIPTQGLASIEAIKIKGFLSESEGDTIVLPSAIVKKAGSDYDIDKLNVYLPNFYIDDKGKATYINPNINYHNYVNHLKEGEKALSANEYRLAQIENRIIEIQKNIILHPANYKNLTTPLDETGDIIKRLTNTIYETRTGNKRDNKSYLNIIDRIALTNTAERFLASKQAVGITALASPFHILAQMSGLTMSHINENGESNYINLPHNMIGNSIALGKSKATDKSDIGMALRQWISEAVDAAKDPRMFDLNVNLETLNTVLYLTMAGVPTDTVLWFINQPIIHDYIQLKDSTQSMLQAVNTEVKSQNRDGSRRYGPKTKTEKDIRSILEAKYGKSGKSKEDTSESLKEYIIQYKSQQDEGKFRVESDLGKTQMRILDDYLRYKKAANLLGDAMQGASWDTNSAGKSIPELLLRLHNSDKVLGTFIKRKNDASDITKSLDETSIPVLGNYDTLLEGNNSFIKPYYQNNKNLLKEFAPLFKVSLTDPGVKSHLDFLIKRFDEVTKISKDDKNSILDSFVQSYMTSMLINNPYFDSDTNLNEERDRLVKGSDTVAKRLDNLQKLFKDIKNAKTKEDVDKIKANKLFQKDGKFDAETLAIYRKAAARYADSPLLNTLIPNVSDENKVYDHVIMYNKKFDILESLELVNDWKQMLSDEIDVIREFAQDLIKLSLLQTGIEYSPISFTNLIPSEEYSKIILNAMNGRSTDEVQANYDAFKSFIEYTIRNTKNNNLVPYDKDIWGDKKIKYAKFFPFVKLPRELKDEHKNKSKEQIASLIKKGKSVYKDNNPLKVLGKDNSKLDLSQYIKEWYVRQDGALLPYGMVDKYLIDLFSKQINSIFEAQKFSESIEEEGGITENVEEVNETSPEVNELEIKKIHLLEQFDSGLLDKVFGELNVHRKQITQMNDNEVDELIEKLCKSTGKKFGR